MKRDEAIAQLQHASRAVKLVLPALDLTFKACSGCGKPHFNDWTDAQVGRELEAVVRKLERLSRKLAAK